MIIVSLRGIEAMHMSRKGQAEFNSTALSTIELINKLLGLASQFKQCLSGK
jgi:IS6 family transposase